MAGGGDMVFRSKVRETEQIFLPAAVSTICARMVAEDDRESWMVY
jgi:hypothetical protein